MPNNTRHFFNSTKPGMMPFYCCAVVSSPNLNSGNMNTFWLRSVSIRFSKALGGISNAAPELLVKGDHCEASSTYSIPCGICIFQLNRPQSDNPENSRQHPRIPISSSRIFLELLKNSICNYRVLEFQDANPSS
ncbi:hypothetical protein MTR67_010610 [Solanum verrucosum]|uniref:Uncharacterized protein n=1 Tax=Solanum verrucosum TaxID=315347 RepID=A0AAF0Q7U9_SOLVR|nr:hypothetical protein MTR67_010610 [Solanum verrucosum]